MGFDVETVTIDRVDGPFQILVLEGLDPAADVTDDVVVVMTGRVDFLVAEGGPTEVDAPDQVELLQLLNRPVDGGATDPGQTGVHLQGRERAVLTGEQVDHLLPG